MFNLGTPQSSNLGKALMRVLGRHADFLTHSSLGLASVFTLDATEVSSLRSSIFKVDDFWENDVIEQKLNHLRDVEQGATDPTNPDYKLAIHDLVSFLFYPMSGNDFQSVPGLHEWANE